MDQIYRQIVTAQAKMRDYFDNPNDTAARRLANEVQRLEDDAQTRKNPRSIEDRIKQIIRLLDGPVRSSRAMSPDHIDDLRNRLVDVQMQLRKLQ